MDKSSSNIQARSCMARTLVEYDEKLAQRKTALGYRKAEPRQCNARKLRGILYIDPDDLQFKDTMESARTVLKVQMESVMPCKSRSTSGEEIRRRKSVRIQPKVERNKKTYHVRGNNNDGDRSRVSERQTISPYSSMVHHQGHALDCFFSDPITLDPMIQVKYVNDHSLVTSRTNFFDTAQDKRGTQCQLTLKSKWRTLQTCWNFRNQNAPIFGFDHDTGGQELDNTFKSLRFLLKGICADLPSSVDCCGRDSSRRSWLKMDGRKHCPGYVYFCKNKWVSSIRVRGRHLDGRDKAQPVTHVEKIDETSWSGETHAVERSSLLGMHSTWM